MRRLSAPYSGKWFIADRLHRLVPKAALLLLARLAITVVFLHSARTKIEGMLTLTHGTYGLFSTECAVPLIPPVIAAHAATYSELLFPILTVLNLIKLLSALALLGMTAVIKIFVHPDAWPRHLSWAALLLFLVVRGGGTWSLDQLIRAQA